MRTIDADALMKIVDSEIERVEEEMRDAEERPNLYTDDFRKHKSYTVSGMAHIAQDILEAPTIDAVPVVRCKDCKWQDKGENDSESWNMCMYRPWSYKQIEDTDFCSDGKRKDNEIRME